MSKDKLPSDIIAREKALNPSKSFIVQAPAGSGKTHTLTHRILALIPTVKKPEEILAITFTNKAASEMRSRLIKELREGQSELAIKAREYSHAQKWDLINTPSRLNIKTIDAFCAQLVRSTPFISGAGAAPTQSENFQVLYENAIRRTLAKNKDYVIHFLNYIDNNMNSAIQLLSDMLGKRDQWIHIVSNSDEYIADKLVLIYAEYLKSHITFVSQALSKLDFRFLHECAQYSIAASEYLGNSPLAWDKLKNWDGREPKPLKQGNIDFSEYLTFIYLAHFLTTKTHAIRKTVSKKDGFPSAKEVPPGLEDKKQTFIEYLEILATHENIVQALTDLKFMPTEPPSEQVLHDIAYIMDTLKDAHEELQKEFQRTSEVDFQEIALRAIQALSSDGETPTELLLKKDQQIQHILIDEFQDTSKSQMDLLNLLVSGWDGSQNRTLFLVGDPMQSIYRFRKAEVGLFLKVWQEKRIGNVFIEPLSFVENFRSSPTIIDWVNKTFQSAFPIIDNISTGAIHFHRSVAFKEAEPTDQVDIRLYAGYQDKGDDPEKATQEALLDLCQTLSSKNKSTAILVRSRTHITPLLPEFQKRGIPINCVDLLSLWDYPEVIDIVQLIKALVQINDRIAWASLLRSPLCGLDMATLTKLLDNHHNPFADLTIPSLLFRTFNDPDSFLNQIPSDVRKRLLRFTHLMLRQLEEDSGLPFSSQVLNLWRALGGDIIYPDDNARNNIEVVLKILDSLAPYGDLDVHEFEKAVKEHHASTFAQDGAIEIMTMHKSKGLEFDHVIVYGLDRGQNRGDSPIVYTDTLSTGEMIVSPKKASFEEEGPGFTTLIKRNETQRNEYEKMRLLYVACTRAKSHLHIFASTLYNDNHEEVKQSSLWHTISEHFKEDVQIVHINQDTEELQTLPNHHLMVIDDASIENSESVNQPQYTHLTKAGIDFLNEQKYLPYEEKELDSFWGSLNFSSTLKPRSKHYLQKQQAHFGEVFHQFMEWMALDKMQGWDEQRIDDSSDLIEKTLHLYKVSDRVIKDAVSEIQKSLKAAISHPQLKEWIQTKNCMPEWSVYTQHDSQTKNRIIDLLVLDKDEIILLDYKTDARLENESISEFKSRLITRYKEKMAEYLDILKQYYPNMPIRSYLYATALSPEDVLIELND
ncbi:UvrD-helicase domain-containing protein [Basilea psittacipulmonis]|uniref:DNA 3'-5' helicase n=1 Tax=Basilea psittacipulmonis DSM 24701 TaxID=1072685 RepID=A0A077DJJ4_9BURK|nr:UvrD-helicase domain-containing protein [Basilea psittacipulmonis]AIL33223.1 hypothetical protein IX83_07885 [Basilea psittacipulmonis DSM 24701]